MGPLPRQVLSPAPVVNRCTTKQLLEPRIAFPAVVPLRPKALPPERQGPVRIPDGQSPSTDPFLQRLPHPVRWVGVVHGGSLPAAETAAMPARTIVLVTDLTFRMH
jgi:hypothetical protein